MKRLWCVMTVAAVLAATGSAAEKKGNPMDANSDGKVSKEEFCAAQEKRMEKAGKEFKKAGAEKMFAKKDANGDGFLTGDELKAKPKPPKADEEE